MGWVMNFPWGVILQRRSMHARGATMLNGSSERDLFGAACLQEEAERMK